MTRNLWIAGVAAIALIAPAAADPGKNENGKGAEKQLEKFEKKREKQIEKAFKHAEKRGEKFAKQQRKMVEQADKRDDKIFEQERKFVEKRDKHLEKLAERQSKAVEKAFERDAKRLEKMEVRSLASVGQRLNDDWFRNPLPVRYQSQYKDSGEHYYRYDPNGYMYQVSRDNGIVSSLIPLLGGGFSVGQMLPVSYADPVPLQFRELYRDDGNAYYRSGDNAIYQVDAKTNLIQGIVALLTGNSLGVGQQLPMGYDAYNVPLAYRDQYQDSADSWYRYDDGNIYQVDPTTRLITQVIDAIV